MTRRSAFCDDLRIHVVGGRGGDGAVHFARFKYKPKGGPDGGDGGDGGSVYLVGDSSLEGLEHISSSRLLSAEFGGKGQGAKKTGKRGADLALPVPLGTRAFDESSSIQLAELTENGQEVRVAAGGKGGRGNLRFATPKNKAPMTAEEGHSGEERRLHLVFRVFARVAVLEDPAGEHSLLRGLMGGKLSSPHRFFQRPRRVDVTVGFSPVSVSVLPLTLERGVEFHFLNHLYYAERAIINTSGFERSSHFDAVYPTFIKAVQKLPCPSLASVTLVAREDPGLPCEVEMGGQRVKVEFAEVPTEVKSFSAFWKWAQDALARFFVSRASEP